MKFRVASIIRHSKETISAHTMPALILAGILVVLTGSAVYAFHGSSAKHGAANNSPLSHSVTSTTPTPQGAKLDSPSTSSSPSASKSATQPSPSSKISSLQPAGQEGSGSVYITEVGSTIRPNCTTITFTASFRSTQTATLSYYWTSSTGVTSPPQHLAFSGAESKTVTYAMPYPVSGPYYDGYGRDIHSPIKGSITLVVTSPTPNSSNLPFDWGSPSFYCSPSPTPAPGY